MAKLVAARSDIEGAKADIHLAQAELENASALAGYTKIVSPWDGIVIGAAITWETMYVRAIERASCLCLP